MTPTTSPTTPRAPRRAGPKVAAGALVVLLGVSAAATALADTTTTTAPAPPATAPTAPKVAGAARLAAVRARAQTAIARRVATLDRLSGRITADTSLSSSVRATLLAAVQSDRAALSALSAKIGTDATAAAIRADLQAARSAAASRLGAADVRAALWAGRADKRLGTLTAAVPRLQQRIATAQQAGHDVTAAQAALTDLQAKAADATRQIDTMVAAVTGADSSGVAAAKAAITADLEALRGDAHTIRTTLGAGTPSSRLPSSSAPSSSTPSTTAG